MQQSRMKLLAAATLGIALVACSSGNNGTNTKSAATQAAAPAGSAASATRAAAPGSPAAGSPAAAASAAAQKVKTGGTLTMGLSRDATNLDSAKSQDAYSGYVEGNVVEPLFVETVDFKVAGNLVDKVDNPDDKTYVFHLHPGIKFQDGTDFNADAVKWNLQRHIDDKSSVRHTDVQNITAMDIIDPTTLKITLDNAFAPFLDKLTSGAGYMYSPTTFQKVGADKIANDLTGAGTGPFKFTSWQHDNQIVLDKNPTYWRKDANGIQYPYLDKIVLKPIPDENTRLTALKTGDLDYIEVPPAKDVKSLQSSSDITYKQIPGFGFDFIMMETEKEPFNDKRVREAFSYSIDRQQIADTVNFGTRVPADTEIPGTIPGSVQGPYMKRDINKAKDLLKQAGKTSVSFTIQYSNASPALQQTMELVKDEIKDAGFDMQLQPLEFATVVDNANKGAYQAGALGWSGSVDPDGFTYTLFTTGAGFNLAHYSNKALDDLLNKARQTLDINARVEQYKQSMNILADDEPFIIYDWTVLQQTTRKNVQNYQLGPPRWIQLYMVWKS